MSNSSYMLGSIFGDISHSSPGIQPWQQLRSPSLDQLRLKAPRSSLFLLRMLTPYSSTHSVNHPASFVTTSTIIPNYPSTQSFLQSPGFLPNALNSKSLLTIPPSVQTMPKLIQIPLTTRLHLLPYCQQRPLLYLRDTEQWSLGSFSKNKGVGKWQWFDVVWWRCVLYGPVGKD